MTSEPVYLCRLDELEKDSITGGLLPCGHRVAIYMIEGEGYVTDDRCSHGDASLSEEGTIDGCQVECSWHFGRFDIRTGEPVASPCTQPIQTYRVTVRGGSIYVAVGDALRLAPSSELCPGEDG